MRRDLPSQSSISQKVVLRRTVLELGHIFRETIDHEGAITLDKPPAPALETTISYDKMGKKKRSHATVEELLSRAWCYYCELPAACSSVPKANTHQASENSRT